MAVAIATKVDALRVDFGSAARLADMLGVSRAQVTRWLRGSGIDPLNAEKVDLLELVWSNLLRLYDRQAAVQDHANESERSARIARISSSVRPSRIRSIGRRSPNTGLSPNSQASAASRS